MKNTPDLHLFAPRRRHCSIIFWLLLALTVFSNGIALFYLALPSTSKEVRGQYHHYSRRHKILPHLLYIAMGSLRGGESTWDTLRRNFIEPNKPYAEIDLALAIGESDNVNSSLVHMAKYVWFSREYEDWGSAVDLIGGDGRWREIASSSSAAGMGANVFGGTQSGNAPFGNGIILPWFRWFVYRKLLRLNLFDWYDVFILTRTDQYYLCPTLVVNLPRGKVWIPEGVDFGGLSDRWIMCDKEDFVNSTQLLTPIVLDPMAYKDKIKSFNPEKLFEYRMRENRILDRVGRFPRTMFAASMPGDINRWALTPIRGPSGVQVKYVEEWVDSHLACDGGGDLMCAAPNSSDSHLRALGLRPCRLLYIVLGGGYVKSEFDAFREDFFAVNRNVTQIDIALVLEPASFPSREPFFRFAKYVWFSDEFDDWAGACAHVDGGDHASWRAIAASHSPDSRFSLFYGPASDKPGKVIPWARWFVYLMIRRLKLLTEYDRFIFTRKDYSYGKPITAGMMPHGLVNVPYDASLMQSLHDWVMCDAMDILSLMKVLAPLHKDPARLVANVNDEEYFLQSLGKVHLDSRVNKFAYPSQLRRVRAQ